MNCKRFREVMIRVVDNEITQEVCLTVEEHVGTCPKCAAELEHYRRLKILLRERCAPTRAPSSLREKILTSFPHRRGPREPWG